MLDITSKKENVKKKIKNIEIFYFINPLKSECWLSETIINKLILEYGDKLSVKCVLYCDLSTLNKSNKQKQLLKKHSNSSYSNGANKQIITNTHNIFLALKSVEIYGSKKASLFRRKLQDALFVHDIDVSKISVLKKLSQEINIDSEEFFINLLNSNNQKSFQNDLQICSDMYVTDSPTFVFFNTKIKDDGLKISGLYSYQVYDQIINEISQAELKKNTIPPLNTLLADRQLISSNEICELYSMSHREVTSHMTDLFVQGSAIKIPTPYGDFWRLI